MASLTPEEIDHLSSLARVDLSAEEKASLSEQLPRIVGFVDTLRGLASNEETVATNGVPLTSLREDKPSSEGLDLETISGLAPEFDRNQVVVPPVLPGNQDG